MWSPDQQPYTVTCHGRGWLPCGRWGGPTQSRGARLLLERHHLPSSNPKGGSERPLHQLAWSQALLGGEFEAENLSFLVRLSYAASLHCSCGVWLVKETPTVSCEVEVRVLPGAGFYQ